MSLRHLSWPVLAGLLVLIGCNTRSDKDKQPVTPEDPNQTKAPSIHGALAQILPGMTEQEVVSLLGKPRIRRAVDKEAILTWLDGSRAVVVVLSSERKVAEIQAGGLLQEPAKVVPANFDRIKPGNSLKQVQEILGPFQQLRAKDRDQTIAWRIPDEYLLKVLQSNKEQGQALALAGLHLQVTLQSDKVRSKSQGVPLNLNPVEIPVSGRAVLKGKVMDSGSAAAGQPWVVWVEPPGGRYFPPLPADKKTWKDEIVIELASTFRATSPNEGIGASSFTPAVVAAFPQYYDCRHIRRTGQVVKVVNKGPARLNVAYGGQGGSGNQFLQQGQSHTLRLNADRSNLVMLGSSIDRKLRGYVWALDTPYHALTGPDGRFEIKNLPADTEVTIIAWNETKGFAPDKKGTSLKLKEGENIHNIKVRP